MSKYLRRIRLPAHRRQVQDAIGHQGCLLPVVGDVEGGDTGIEQQSAYIPGEAIAQVAVECPEGLVEEE